MPKSEAGKRLLSYAILGNYHYEMERFRVHIASNTRKDSRGNVLYTLDPVRMTELLPRLEKCDHTRADIDPDHFDMNVMRSWNLLKYGKPVCPTEQFNECLTLVTFADRRGNVGKTSQQEIRMGGLRIPVSARRVEIMTKRRLNGEI